MSAQDRTLGQYHELMQLNAVSQVLRSAREVGVFDALAGGQRTAVQICEALMLLPKPTALLLDALVAVGIVEKYGDDYALSQAAQLLCQYDNDLGDELWSHLVRDLRGDEPRREHDDRKYFEGVAATQWVHTKAAIQAAEILDIGGEDAPDTFSILDLGCGAAVWSSSMAFRHVGATVTGVDHAGELAAAASTVASIDLTSRFTAMQGDPDEIDLPADSFDLVLIAQRLHAKSIEDGDRLLARAVGAAKPEGRVVVIDLFRGPGRPNLSECVAALRLELSTQGGRMGALEESKQRMEAAGLSGIQFSFLAASRVNLGLMVGVKR